MFEDGEMEETENNEESTSLSGDEDSVLREELKLLLEVHRVCFWKPQRIRGILS